MADMGSARASNAVAFMVAAGLVFEIIAAACSSPQTAEINADTRSDTLMKWVMIGLVLSGFFIIIAAAIERERAPAILSGGFLAGGIMGGMYVHANRAGLMNTAEGTEG